MTDYSMSGNLYSDSDPNFKEALRHYYQGRVRPLCVCQQPFSEMYICKINDDFYIKRMPNTGRNHALTCSSYEEPKFLSGKGGLDSNSITTDSDSGETTLKINFSLNKSSISREAVEPTNTEKQVVKADPKTLSIRGLLHYLLDEGGVTQYNGSYRNWASVRGMLLKAVDDHSAKKVVLADRLFIPEPFSIDDIDGIKLRRKKYLDTLAPCKNTNKSPLGLLIGEIKHFDTSRFGYKAVIKHMPDYHFFIDKKTYNQIHKAFPYELSVFNDRDDIHLITIATFAINPSGYASVESISLICLDRYWIPFDSMRELEMNDALIKMKKTFKKGLKYNLLSKDLIASYIVRSIDNTDVACFFAGEAEFFTSDIVHSFKDSGLYFHLWDEDAPPPLLIP